MRETSDEHHWKQLYCLQWARFFHFHFHVKKIALNVCFIRRCVSVLMSIKANKTHKYSYLCAVCTYMNYKQ